MINYFPSLYEDELVYSLFARYYQKTGYTTYRDVASDLFQNPAVRTDIEFINQLTDDAFNHIQRIKPIERVILENTMYSYYGRFMEKERRQNAYTSLVQMTGNHMNLLMMKKSKGKDRYLRYCPLCSKEHREHYGETYWMRVHQCPDTRICYKHNCFLKDSNVRISGKSSPGLFCADLIIPEEEKVVFNQNSLEYELVKYMIAIFQAPIYFENDIGIGQFLNYKLAGTPYLSHRGETRKIARLYNDFMEYYESLDVSFITELWQLQKIFTGYKCGLADIAQLALFLKIPIEELIHPEVNELFLPEKFDAMIKQMHNSGMNYGKIARQLGASYDVVKAVGEGRYKKQYSKVVKPRKTGVKCYEWEKIDKALLPDVIKAVEEIYGGDLERPHRVTAYAVSRKLALSDKYLQHLPLCMDVIKEKYEKYEVYFAREIVWAAKQILTEEGVLNYTGIRRLTNLRRKHFDACKPYLDEFANKELADRIRQL